MLSHNSGKKQHQAPPGARKSKTDVVDAGKVAKHAASLRNQFGPPPMIEQVIAHILFKQSYYDTMIV